MADNTTELEVLDEIVDVLGGTSGQYETVVPVLQQIKELLAAGITDPEAIAEAVAAWLDEHPEATTTVQDGSITGVKIADDTISDAKLAQTGGVLGTVGIIESQIVGMNGVIVPPPFILGTRYVSNGAEAYSSNNVRMTFALGTYIDLKQGDVVMKDASVINYFGGGYTADGGSTFVAVPTQTGNRYVVQADGEYFFWVSKPNDAAFTVDEIADGWKYITFTRSGSLKDTVDEIASDTSIADIKTAIDYQVDAITPTDFYVLPNVGKDINSSGALYESSATSNIDTSGFIPLSGLYGVCRVVTNMTKFPLGGIYYYGSASEGSYIDRRFPGTNYEFDTFNGETVVWMPIDSTISGAKYIRFTSDNNRGFRFWVVESGPQAGVLDEYAKLPFAGKSIVNFGDSIFGLTRPPHDVSSYLAQDTGATVYNAGFGGCEMSTHADSNYNPFSMCNLASAVASGNWSSQEAAASASGMPAYFSETVTMLESIDFNDVDIVTIGYGTNDWNNSSPLDNGGNTNMAYFADALRYSIETLLTAYPNLRIFVCTQTYRFWMDSQGQFTEDSNTKVNATTNLKLTDFVSKTIEVAKEYQLPYIDNYNIGMNRYNRSQYFYPTDGTHPTPTGNQLIAGNIAKSLF